MGYPLPLPRFVGYDERGIPLAGGRLYCLSAGSATPATTYADAAMTTPHAFPVVLDADGSASIYLAPGTGYKLILRNASDAVQWVQDNLLIPVPADAVTPPDVPVGALMAWGAAAAPTGYLLCDGSAVSRATYAALFAVVSTLWGVGDGSTTFNLPDLRQRFPLGKATAGTGATLGSTGGSGTQTVLPAHTHTVSTSTYVVNSATSHRHALTPNGWGATSGTAHASGQLITSVDAVFPYDNLAAGGFDLPLAAVTTIISAEDAHTHVMSNNATATAADFPAYLAVNFVIKS